MKHLRSRAGFGLPEVLIAGTLMILISVELSRTFNYTYKAQRHIAQTSDAQGVENLMRQVLTNSAGCAATVTGLDPTITTNQTIALKSSSSNTMLAVNSIFGNTKVAELYANFLQTTGTLRLTKITARVEKIGAPGVRLDWTFDAHVNVTVNSSNVVVGCVSPQGSLMKMENYQSKFKTTGDGYEFKYAAVDSEVYDATSDFWKLTRNTMQTNCALSTANRDKGCALVAYPAQNFTALGSLTTVQSMTGICVTNPETANTFAGIASVRITCGSTSQWTNVASLSNNNNNALCLNGTTLRVHFATSPGDTCTLQPYIGWSWFPPPPTGPNPVGAGASLKVNGYPFNFVVEHYQ